MKLNWKDITSYTRGGSNEPNCWSVTLFGGMRVSVMRKHLHHPGVWFVAVTQISLEQELPGIPLDDISAAQEAALVELRKYLMKLQDSAWGIGDVTEDPVKILDDMDEVERLAERFYTTYCRSVGGKAYDGKPLPPWEEFDRDETKIAQSNGWRNVAREAIAAETGIEAAPLMTPKADEPKETALDFSGKPDPAAVSQFFLDLVRGILWTNDIQHLVVRSGVQGTTEEVYRRLNAPGHPVRDGLILLGNNLK